MDPVLGGLGPKPLLADRQIALVEHRELPRDALDPAGLLESLVGDVGNDILILGRQIDVLAAPGGGVCCFQKGRYVRHGSRRSIQVKQGTRTRLITRPRLRFKHPRADL